ncbi:hypothetical protein V495_05726, partial [Pseudogymnoascus sp. VKM F-4514 (FW-929)]
GGGAGEAVFGTSDRG